MGYELEALERGMGIIWGKTEIKFRSRASEGSGLVVPGDGGGLVLT